MCGICGQPMQGSHSSWLRNGKRFYKPMMRCKDGCTAIQDALLMEAMIEAITALENAADDADLAVQENGQQQRLQDGIRAAQERLKAIDDRRHSAVDDLQIYDRITAEEFDRTAAVLGRQRRGIESEIDELQQRLAEEDSMAQRGVRIEEVRGSARKILAEAEEHPDLVKPWLQKYVRLYVGKGRGSSRVEVVFI